MTDAWWGYVASLDPLRVSRTLGGSALVTPAGCLLEDPRVGDRVRVEMDGTAAVIVGRQRGSSAPGSGGVYTDWTPTMAVDNGTGAQPTWGNSLRQGRYTIVGSKVDFHGYINIGSNFSPGSATGTWSMPLPVPAALHTQSIVQLYFRCLAWLGGTAEIGGFARIENANHLLRLWATMPATAPQLATGSRGWASNDRIIVSGTYEGDI